VRSAWWQNAPPAYSENTPFEAAAWLQDHPDLPGPLWAELAFSTYLTYALPERPVWIYPRFEAFPPEQWERYLLINNASPGWEQALQEEGVRLVLASKLDQSQLVQALRAAPGWQFEYEDDISVIFSAR
jgi:hypothetical protein